MTEQLGPHLRRVGVQVLDGAEQLPAVVADGFGHLSELVVSRRAHQRIAFFHLRQGAPYKLGERLGLGDLAVVDLGVADMNVEAEISLQEVAGDLESPGAHRAKDDAVAGEAVGSALRAEHRMDGEDLDVVGQELLHGDGGGQLDRSHVHYERPRLHVGARRFQHRGEALHGNRKEHVRAAGGLRR